MKLLFSLFALAAIAKARAAPVHTLYKAVGAFSGIGAAAGAHVAYESRGIAHPPSEVRKAVAAGAAVGAGVGLCALAWSPFWLAGSIYDSVTRPERFTTFQPQPSLPQSMINEVFREMERKQIERREAGK
jgi:hypothetical protein